MPMIIPKQDIENWLAPDTDPNLNAYIARASEIQLQAWPVTKRMNNARFNDPICIKSDIV
jgi:putative SOS response-associated peptidase YedK